MNAAHAQSGGDFFSKFSMKARYRFRPLGAIIGPINFSLKTGHFRSALKRTNVDRHGSPLPFYTYPGIRYLSEIDFSQADVLEFGAGNSSIWWNRRARSLTTLEFYQQWRDYVAKSVKGNCVIRLVTSPAHGASLIEGQMFDVIVVDDASGDIENGREINGQTAFAHIKPTEIVIVDNSNADYSLAISQIGTDAGWKRIDFVGFSGGTIREFCTSIFLKPETCALWPASDPMVFR